MVRFDLGRSKGVRFFLEEIKGLFIDEIIDSGMDLKFQMREE